MIRWLLLFVSLLAAAQTQQFRFLTYNIHHGEGTDGRLDMARIAAVISSADPDFAAIQEVDVRTTRVHGADLAHELSKLTGLHAVFGKSIDFSGGWYGNALLSRWPLNGFVIHPLPGTPGREKRAVVLADSGFGFDLLGTHLDTAEPGRLLAAERLSSLVKEKPAGRPMVLAGDLNAAPGSATMKALFRDWTSASLDRPLLTIPVAAPERQIDYVLFRPANRWRVVAAKVLEESVASDHRALLVTLELLPANIVEK